MNHSLAGLFLLLAGIIPAAAQPRQPPKPPEISRDTESLPQNVRRMRGLLLEAMRSGESAALRKPIEWNEVPPSFGKGAPRGAKGPAMADELVRFFRSRSGDGQGRETMGQVINILAVGHARIHAGQSQEMYVWPYFAALDPRLLTPEQEVDVFRVLSAPQLAEWREKGRFPYWRIGIGPDGTWHYFLGGE
jgi:hypothetical protein